ncbi:MAG: hypothetical protein ABIB71_05250 [Candidatus Woesearchaeota archaeon]
MKKLESGILYTMGTLAFAALSTIVAASVQSNSNKKSMIRSLNAEAIENTTASLEEKFKDYDKAARSLSPIKLDNLTFQEVREIASNPIEARALVLAYKERNGLPEEPNGDNSFKDTHEKKVGVDCTESAIIAAAVLSDDGYKPLILAMRPEDDEGIGHEVFIYRQDGKFGYVSNNYVAEPRFSSIEGMIGFISKKVDEDYVKYAIYDLDKEDPDWLESVERLKDKWVEYKDID